MEHRAEAAWEPLFGAHEIKDEMSAHMLRLGGRKAAMGPNPRSAGGYYLFVANGNLDWSGTILPLWSMVVVEPDEDAIEIRAGDHGLEVLILQFPREEQ